MIVPLLDHDPNGTKWMPIKRLRARLHLRPALGCQQAGHRFRARRRRTGLVTQNPHKLRAIRVFFFDMDALPPPPPDGTILQDYFGSGPKIVSMIN